MSDIAKAGRVTWQDRYQEWKALYNYCRENEEELEQSGRMRALVFCLQAHWQDMNRLKTQEEVTGESQ